MSVPTPNTRFCVIKWNQSRWCWGRPKHEVYEQPKEKETYFTIIASDLSFGDANRKQKELEGSVEETSHTKEN